MVRSRQYKRKTSNRRTRAQFYSSPALVHPRTNLPYATFYARQYWNVLATGDPQIIIPQHVFATAFWEDDNFMNLSRYYSQAKVISMHCKFVPNNNLFTVSGVNTSNEIVMASTHYQPDMDIAGTTLTTIQRHLDYRVWTTSSSNSQVISRKWKANFSNPLENEYLDINGDTAPEPTQLGGIILGINLTAGGAAGTILGVLHTTWKFYCYGQGVISLTVGI